MDRIFPTEGAVLAELAALRRQRETLDAAITEREFFLGLGRKLATGEDGARGRQGADAAARAPAPAGSHRDADDPRPSPAASVRSRAMELGIRDGAREPGGDAGFDPPRRSGPAGDDDAGMPAPSAPARPATAGMEAALSGRAAARVQGRRLLAEALAILAATARPMHAAELVPLLAERGLTLPGRDPVAALNTRLWKRARTGHLVRHGDAVYAAPRGAMGTAP